MGNAIPSSELIPKFTQLMANPYACGRMLLRTLEQATDGKLVFVDPTNPATLLLESAIVLSTAQMLQAEALTRKQYSSMAQDMTDLYRHMSDKDYLGRFSTPAKGSITLMLLLDEVKLKADYVRNAQGLPDGTGIRKLTIPKHSEFYVANVTFLTQYAIDIRVMPHGGIQVVYDTTGNSPFYKLESNRVDHGISRQGQYQFLRITFPVLQLAALQQIAQLNNATGFSKNYKIQDRFYYCRAYVKSSTQGTWTEIKTTHSDQVFDPTTPTVLLKVLDGSVDVQIPQIYFNTGLVRDSLRLDFYTTRGELEMDLGSYQPSAFTANWLDRDGGTDTTYVKPLLTFSGLAILSDAPISGGSNGVDFSTLRNRVITQGLSSPTVPVSENQLISTADGAGYQLVKSIDSVTNRIFLATRALPAPEQTLVSNTTVEAARTTLTSAGCTMLMLQSSLDKLAQEPTITDSGSRLTIKPNTLFQQVNGVLSVTPRATVLDLLNENITPVNALAYAVNTSKYFYTPFFYVLDTDEDTFSTRAYQLSTPAITSKSYFAENVELAIEVSTQNYSVICDLDNSEYTLVLRLAVGDTFTEIELEEFAVQLSYLPPNSSTRVFFTGELKEAEDEDNVTQYYALFSLKTKFDVNPLHELVLEPLRTTAALTTDMDLTYILRNPPIDVARTDIDDLTDPTLLVDYDEADVYRGILHERLTIRFGRSLERLWTRSRSVASTRVVSTYDADIMGYYAADVLLRDELGNLVLDWDSNTNTLSQTVLHHAGDPMLEPDGSQVVLHRKGTPILNVDGDVQYLRNDRVMERQTELLLLDGRYYFATDDTVLNYRDSLVRLMAEWITTDIATLAVGLFENTELYFYPKITAGAIDVYVGSGQSVRVDADQSFQVEFYMSEDKYKNEAIRASIAQSTPQIISDVMAGATVSISSMLSALKLALGDDIISVKVTSEILGESDATTKRYQAFTVKDQSLRPNIGKQLLALSNLKLTVVDSVNVSFIKHL